MPLSEKVLRLAEKCTPLDVPTGVYVVTRDGRFVACNRQVCEILGLDPETSPDASILDFYYDPQQRDEILAKNECSERTGRWGRQVLHLRVNGREKFVEDYSRSLRDESGEVIGFLCCMTDITDEYRSDRLFESLPVGAYQLDEHDRSVHANRAFARILGYSSPEEIEGRPVKDFYAHPE
ncbi:MAG: PAS domain S-box protein, partial [Acidobacteria bacterium]|nr:PAS domain S-box protein [Acidobacteriota bacterium]